jgi:hypothetical protein
VIVVGVTAGQLTVERAMVSVLGAFVPEYVVAAARRYAREEAFGIDSTQMEAMLEEYALPYRPRGLSVVTRFSDWPIDALPHIQVISPSWAVAGGSQSGRTIKYEVQVACVVEAQNQDDTRLFRACYEDAILGAVDQHQALGGIAAGIDAVGGGGEQLNEISEQDARTFQGSVAVFQVTVNNVVDATAGPNEPSEGDGVPEAPEAGPIFEADGDEPTLVPEAIT